MNLETSVDFFSEEFEIEEEDNEDGGEPDWSEDDEEIE